MMLSSILRGAVSFLPSAAALLGLSGAAQASVTLVFTVTGDRTPVFLNLEGGMIDRLEKGPPPIRIVPPILGCLDGQVDIGARLARNFLRCHARHTGPSLAACTDASSERFTFDIQADARRGARERGIFCRDGIDSALVRVMEDLEQLRQTIGANLDPVSKHAARYRAKLYKIAAKAVFALLRAESRNLDHANPEKLSNARARLEVRVAAAVDRANRRAVSRGLEVAISRDEMLDAIGAIVSTTLDISDETIAPIP